MERSILVGPQQLSGRRLEFREGMRGRRITLRGLLSSSLIVFGGCTTPDAVDDSEALYRALGEALSERRIEPRTSLGERWSECRPPDRPDLVPDVSCTPVPPIGSAERNRLIRTVAQVRTAAAKDENPRVLHLLGLAQLLAGDDPAGPETDEAVATLERAHARAEDNAAILSDLAAVRLVAAQRMDRPLDLVAALEAADAALKRDPTFEPALFNRALALTHLFLRSEALAAWDDYLGNEKAVKWLEEGQHWRAQLAAEGISEQWDEAVKLLERAIATGTPHSLDQLTGSYPQQIRVLIEESGLGAWGDAYHAGEVQLAAARLDLIRHVAIKLAIEQSDDLLSDAVALIISSDSSIQSDLAEAHRLYRDARFLHERQQYGRADQLFARAATRFARHDSAFLFWPLLYRAIIIHHRPAFGAARSSFARLRDDDRFRSGVATAYLNWMEGLNELRLANYSVARERFVSARSLFLESAEMENAAAMSLQASFAEDELGRASEAWRGRYLALKGLTHTVKPRRAVTVLSAVAEALEDEGSEVARYFHSESVAVARNARSPLILAFVLAKRAEWFSENEQFADAARDAAEARQLTQSIPEGGVRQDIEAIVDLVDAKRYLVQGRLRAASAAIDRVVAFAEAHQEGRIRIEGYRLRAEIYDAIGDPRMAEASLFEGLREVEAQRRLVKDSEERRGYLEGSRDLTEGLVARLFDQGRRHEALEVLERARAPVLRELLAKSVGRRLRHRSSTDIIQEVPPGTAVLTYFVLEDRVLGWVLERGRLQTLEVLISRSDLSEMVNRYVSEVQAGRIVIGGYGPDSDILLELLANTPISESVDRLVIVPDGPLHDLPFNYLVRQSGREGAVSLAPGVNASLDLAAMGSDEPSPPESILVVTNVANDLFPSLAKLPVWKERRYLSGRATLLAGQEATAEAVLSALPQHDVFYFRGHAVAAPGRPDLRGLVLALDGPEDDGILTPDEVTFPSTPRTRVAILSGCATASGDRSWTEGPIGLAWPLLASGVSSVVVSRWPVSDAEAERFVEGLLAALLAGDQSGSQESSSRRNSAGVSATAAAFAVVGQPI